MTSDLFSGKVDPNGSPSDVLRKKNIFKSTTISKKRMAKDRRKDKGNDDIVRQKIETARARLDDAKSDSTFETISSKTDRPYKRTFSVSNNAKDLPIIYFVVAADKMPFLAKELTNHRQRMHHISHTQRTRKAFYSEQILYMRRKSAEKKRIRDLGADMGLRLEPIKSKTITTIESKPYIQRHHTTPVSASEKSDISNLNDTDEPEDKKTLNISNDGYQEKSSQQSELKPGDDISPKTLELPVIDNLEQTKTKDEENYYDLPQSPEGSASTLKKVHFAEGLPEITGCKIDLIRTDTESEISRDIQRLKKSSVANSVITHSSNMTRSLSEITSRSRVARTLKPMSLPKIDVMSPIYDELLLKTLQTYCMGTNGPKSECDANTLMQKMSAILHPQTLQLEWGHTHRNTTRNQIVNDRLVEASSDFMTKTESSKYESELSVNDLVMERKDDTFLSSVSVEHRTYSTAVTQADENPAPIQTPINTLCFQMIPPGLTKEKSLSFQTLI